MSRLGFPGPAVTRNLQCTLDEAIEEIVCGDNLWDYHNHLEEKVKEAVKTEDQATDKSKPLSEKDKLT